MNEAEEHQKIYGTTCAKPMLFLDQRRRCDGCPYWDVCACASKKLEKPLANSNQSTK